jgi:GTP cyclohydrolase I
MNSLRSKLLIFQDLRLSLNESAEMFEPNADSYSSVISNGIGASCSCELDPEDAGDALTSPVDHERIRRAIREILLAVGEDPDREGLRDTPDRVARMYAEVFSGLHQDPAKLLERTFTQQYDEVVVVKDIEFASFCEHHLLPFTGKAHVGYIPNGKVVGLSKIPRVVDSLARRPQLQERLTQELAGLLMSTLDARGVAVVVEGSHSCMTIRGVRKSGSLMVTSAMLGLFRERHATREEFLSLVMGRRA